MKKLYVVLAFGLAAFVCLVLAMLPPQPGVTKKNYERIQEGMTLANVEKIFGRPGEVRESYRDGRLLAWQPDKDPERDFVLIGVANGRVVTIHWYIGRSRWSDESEDWVDSIRRWLGFN